MFNSKEVPNHQRMIESELERAITALRAETMDSQEYVKALNRVERLYGLLDTEKPRTLNKDAILTAGTNLIGIVLILVHERVFDRVITSKALGFVFRLK